MPARSLFHAAAPPLCVLLGLSMQPTIGAEHTDRSSRTLPISPTTPLTLRATVGTVTVVGWDQPRVDVEVIRQGPSAQRLPAIAVAVQTGEGQASVTALQAPGATDAGLTGSIIVHAPIDQVFGDIDLFEGRISLKNLRRGVRAHVEHGSIDASSLAGRIRLESGIGDVRLSASELSDDGSIRLRTFNGDITLDFGSRPLHARILALSLGGAIHSDLPLAVRTSFGPRFGELTLGRGSPMVSIDVVRGDIRITSARP